MDELRAAFLVAAAFEEAMHEQGLLPDAIRVISANAARKLDELDAAHTQALAGRDELVPQDEAVPRKEAD